MDLIRLCFLDNYFFPYFKTLKKTLIKTKVEVTFL